MSRYQYYLCGACVCSDEKILQAVEVPFSSREEISICRLEQDSELAAFVNRPDYEFSIIGCDYKIFQNDRYAFVLYQDACVIFADQLGNVIYYNYDACFYEMLLIFIYKLLQNRFYYIHAAGFAINGSGYALMAESGTGKSSMLLSLLNRGAHFVTDDQLAVQTIHGKCYASPSSSMLPKLSVSVLQYFYENPSNLQPVLPYNAPTDGKYEKKYYFPLSKVQKCADPVVLQAAFVLRPEDNRQDIEIVPSRKDSKELYSYRTLQLDINNYFSTQERTRSMVQGLREFHEFVQLYVVKYRRIFDSIPCVVDEIFKLISERFHNE